MKELIADLEKWRQDGEKVLFVMTTHGMAERLVDILREYELELVLGDGFQRAIEHDLSVTWGKLSESLCSPKLKLHVLIEANLFESTRNKSVAREEDGPKIARAFLSDFRDLREGDYVVHMDHGVGVFHGLKRIGVGEDVREFVVLAYQKDAKLYVPIDRLDLIQKYRSSGESRPHVDRLGGASWEKTKRTSINYFIDVIGDLPIAAISRDDALSYRNWWMERMIPREEGEKPAKPNTANRHIGNMRTLHEAYFSHKGDEERLNPFRKMFFKGESRVDVPPFEDDWVRSKILAPGIFDDLRWELRCIIYVLIETGCRTSEICNLLPEDIKLKANVPFIRIRPRQNREIKTETSIRDIPLVGVALEAMRAAPEGFEHYRDRGELVSANLMKAFRQRGLFPTTDHVIYSFRHAFEKRMLEAGLDYGLRCTLMGHKTDRPAYGDGGSMAYRRDELMKIAHLVPDGLKFSD